MMAKTKPLMHNPYTPDAETLGETLSNLGVKVERPNKTAVTGAKWARKYAARRPKPPAATVNKKRLYVNVTATELISPKNKQFNIGVGDFNGQRVLLIRESDEGYRLTIATSGSCTYSTSSVEGLLAQLFKFGLKPGRYKLREIKGGWMGVPN